MVKVKAIWSHHLPESMAPVTAAVAGFTSYLSQRVRSPNLVLGSGSRILGPKDPEP